MYKTEIKGSDFIYYTDDSIFKHRMDSWHLTEIAFYNYLLKMTEQRELTIPQLIYHFKCVESFNRAVGI